MSEVWQPTTRQLETIATLGHARAPADKIAAALGVTLEEFSAWAGRLTATRTLDVEAPPLPTPPMRPERGSPKILADRVFETVGEGDDLIDG
jgi:hypothetical protein